MLPEPSLGALRLLEWRHGVPTYFAVVAYLLCAVAFSASSNDGTWPRSPLYKVAEVIPTPTQDDGSPLYAAFPAILDLGDGKLLVTYKAGQKHARDPGAAVRTIMLDLTNGSVEQLQTFEPPEPLLYQCAEPVRFADGSAALFIDTQRIGPEPRHYRAPMRWARSRDGGRTYDTPEIFPVVDEVRYGYPQEGVTVDGTTYVIMMTFGYLEGERWSMDVLATSDNGKHWRGVANLADTFNLPGFNEASLLPWRGGFLVASRSYDGHARVHEVDGSFRLRRQVDLTKRSSWVSGYIGRPRLFEHEGFLFLLGRNWTQPIEEQRERSPDNPLGFPREQQLCLLRLDPATLEPVSCWVLDNAEHAAVSDGYYAVASTADEGRSARLHVITYKGVRGEAPHLLRLEFKWSELLP